MVKIADVSGVRYEQGLFLPDREKISWNFKHIVNVKTVKGVKIITTMEGYKDLLIYPLSALLEGNDEHDDD